MEWERAKNYILIFFLLLNIALGVLLVIENRRYTITFDQERLIRTVLAQNNITMYRLPIRQFPPMRSIEVTGFYYNREALLQIFFTDPQTVERIDTSRSGHYVYQYGDGRLEISDGFVEYRNPGGFRRIQHSGLLLQLPSEITYDSARRITDTFIYNHFPDFVPDGSFNEGDNIRIIYRQKYRSILVHSNSIELLVTPIGIQQVEMQFGEILGYIGSPRMIFSPDEALLAFTQRVRHIAQDEPMTITRMDLVYFQEYISDQPGPYHAVPFYRVFTLCNGDQPFLINAFTNGVID